MQEPLNSATEESPRRRRFPPWWKWNLITLAVSLFLLVWIRELAKFAPTSSFSYLGTIITIWLVVPLFPRIKDFGELITSAAEIAAERKQGLPKFGKSKLIFFAKILSVLIFIFALGRLAVEAFPVLYQMSKQLSFLQVPMPGIGWTIYRYLADVISAFLLHTGVAFVVMLLARLLELKMESSEER